MSIFSVASTEVFPPDDFLTAMPDACYEPEDRSESHAIGKPVFSLTTPMKLTAINPAEDRQHSERPSVSFLVRLWREPREEAQGTASRPRGYVRNLATGDERFVGAERVGELLLAQLEARTADGRQAMTQLESDSHR